MTFEETAKNVLAKSAAEKKSQLAILEKLVDAETKAEFQKAALMPLDQIEQMVAGWSFDPPPARGVPEELIGRALALFTASVAAREKMEKAIAKSGWHIQARKL